MSTVPACGAGGPMPAIDMQAHDDGTVLAVRAQPGARREGVVGVQDGALKVAVTVPPEGGKANKAIALVLARALGVRRSQVALVSGGASRRKRFLIEGLAPEALRERLGEWVQS